MVSIRALPDGGQTAYPVHCKRNGEVTRDGLPLQSLRRHVWRSRRSTGSRPERHAEPPEDFWRTRVSGSMNGMSIGHLRPANSWSSTLTRTIFFVSSAGGVLFSNKG